MTHTLTLKGTAITFNTDSKDIAIITSIAEDLTTKAGFINLDPADIAAILEGSANVTAGVATASGEGRAQRAAREAMKSANIEKAKRILVEVVTGIDVSLSEMSEAAITIEEACVEDVRVVWGHIIDAGLNDVIKVGIAAAV